MTTMAESKQRTEVTVGRIVHYVPTVAEAPYPKCRAAIVTNVFGEIANLTVFMDWSNDGGSYDMKPLFWATSRHFDATGIPLTWHWPPECPTHT